MNGSRRTVGADAVGEDVQAEGGGGGDDQALGPGGQCAGRAGGRAVAQCGRCGADGATVAGLSEPVSSGSAGAVDGQGEGADEGDRVPTAATKPPGSRLARPPSSAAMAMTVYQVVAKVPRASEQDGRCRRRRG